MHPGRAFRRLPIRLRVNLAFALVLAVVLAGTGAFLDLRFAAEMKSAIDQSLRSRAGDVIALVGQADSGLRQAGAVGLSTRARDFAQVLAPTGQIVDSSPQTAGHAVLSASRLPRPNAPGTFIEQAAVAGLVGRVRMLAVPVHAQGRNLVVVVGTTLSDRDRALSNLRTLLLIGGAGALALSALAGFLAIGRALRPIELMRRRADEIGAAEPGSRLPVPPTRDEVARLGGTLNSMLDRLEDALRRERTFVSDASHELRGPLTILKAELELALRGPLDRGVLEHTVRSAAEETDRLVQLAEDLLVIARGEHDHLPLTRSRFDTSELLGGIRDRFATQASALGRRIHVSTPENGRLNADRARIEQALGNMVENALRYGDGDITLWASSPAGGVQLHVSDAGPGFDPAFLPHAFRRFTRADASRSTEGTGLGLAIVATIAAAHQGSAHAANRLGGADVWISLPPGE
ncbi:MAG TPA: ATP-binding protein [Solirubrobacteraceae bacterium]|nr:ATP-binding protein [Solirubrobacteraceae bacterium]